MARPLRLTYPGALYHGTTRGNARQAISPDDQDWQSGRVGKGEALPTNQSAAD